MDNTEYLRMEADAEEYAAKSVDLSLVGWSVVLILACLAVAVVA